MTDLSDALLGGVRRLFGRNVAVSRPAPAGGARTRKNAPRGSATPSRARGAATAAGLASAVPIAEGAPPDATEVKILPEVAKRLNWSGSVADLLAIGTDGTVYCGVAPSANPAVEEALVAYAATAATLGLPALKRRFQVTRAYLGTLRVVLPDPADVTLITGPNARYDLPKEMREFLAIDQHGTLFLTAAGDKSREVQNTLATYKLTCAGQKLPQIQRRIIVLQSYLDRLYGISRETRKTTPADAQTWIIDKVREAVAVGASDVHLQGERNGFAYLKYKLHGRLTPVLDEVILDKADEIMRGTWTLAETDAGAYAESANQGLGLPGSVFGQMPDGKTLERARLTLLRGYSGTEMILRLWVTDGGRPMTLAEQGWDPEFHLPQWDRCARMSLGLVLATGPVGHGKNTTLTEWLAHRYLARDKQDFIITLEDMVERHVIGARQLEYPALKDGQDLAGMLQETLGWINRANPSTYMINEIKLPVTADLMLQFVQSGNLGASTTHAIHSLGAPAKYARWLELANRDPRDIYDEECLSVISSQRLIATLCSCKLSWEAARSRLPDFEAISARVRAAYRAPSPGHFPRPASLAEVEEQVHFANPDGCPHCSRVRGHMSGTIGRTVAGEIVMTSAAIFASLLNHDIPNARRLWIEDGGSPMQAHALWKMFQGRVDPRAVEAEFGPLDRIAATLPISR